MKRLLSRLFYGWVVVITFFTTGIVLWGVRFSFGVFFKSLEAEFELSRATTSSIFSVYMVFGGVFTIVGGLALDRYGPKIIILLMGLFTGLSLLLTGLTTGVWQLFITYSLLLAMGSSAMYVTTMSTISRWFNRKRGLALGIASSGAGLGMVVMAPFATYLITSFDWRVSYIIIGIGAWLLVIPLSMLLKKDPAEIGALPDGVKPDEVVIEAEKGTSPGAGLLLLPALKTRSFWLIIFTWVLFASSVFLLLTHIVPHAIDIGFSAGEAATILSLIGITVIAGRVMMGIISDRIGRKRGAVICALAQAGAMLWLMWVQELWMFYLFALIFGFAYGGMGPTMAALVGDTFGLRRIGSVIGVLDAGFNIGAAIGPAIGGLIFDVSGSYFLAFLYTVGALLAVGVLILLIRQEIE